MLSDLRLYKEEEQQQDCNDMMSESVSSKAQKNWPRKGFQTNEYKGVESAMMCWENLEDSAQEQIRKTTGQDKDTNNDKEKQDNDDADEEHVESTVHTGKRLKIPVQGLKLGVDTTQETLVKN